METPRQRLACTAEGGGCEVLVAGSWCRPASSTPGGRLYRIDRRARWSIRLSLSCDVRCVVHEFGYSICIKLHIFACLQSRDYRYYHMFQMTQVAQSARTGARGHHGMLDRGPLSRIIRLFDYPPHQPSARSRPLNSQEYLKLSAARVPRAQ